MGRDETTAVFCVTEDSAAVVAQADPQHAAAVRRKDARRSFLGLELLLDGVSGKTSPATRSRGLDQQGSKALVKEFG